MRSRWSSWAVVGRVEGVAIVGGDCTPALDVTHRHIRGVLGLHCVGGRAGTGGRAMRH